MAAPPPPPPEGILNTEALQMNDEIVDMCMLLDYETRFCTKELKPMPRTFFAYPAQNPAHQFKYFSQLVAWGLTFLNLKADWDEFDDPTTVMTSMQVSLKDAGVQVCNSEIPKVQRHTGPDKHGHRSIFCLMQSLKKQLILEHLQDVQEHIREKQRQAQAKKKAKKSQDKPLLADDETDKPQRTHITMEEYFAACRGGVFRQDGFRASEEMVEHLLSLDFSQVVGKFRDGTPVRLSSFNYFMFDGTDKQIWVRDLGIFHQIHLRPWVSWQDPTFLARLAYEGFFTITTGRSRDRMPLPELQPYYGVLDWTNFNRSKPVKKALKRIKSDGCDGCKYYLYCNRNLKLLWQGLNQYHKEASDNPKINFSLHSIELYDGPLPEGDTSSATAPNLVAGEIGYSIGKIYTSLSGFNIRGEDGVGWIQLACLGKWLEYKKYSFWSLGHCYSPQMEYKRQLGHRIYTRDEFLERLKLERGSFRLAGPSDFVGLQTHGEVCDMNAILNSVDMDDAECG
eukprot:symbB.v1.2.033837.t1/scaffold4260.1/size42279/2